MSTKMPYIRILVVGALICVLPLVLSSYYMHIAILVLIWAFLACAWNIIGGYAGQHSLGNGLYMGDRRLRRGLPRQPVRPHAVGGVARGHRSLGGGGGLHRLGRVPLRA